jgi:hypothetical protein
MLFLRVYFWFCVIFFLFKWLYLMVTLLLAVGLERITLNTYISLYARMSRCLNERGSGTHCMYRHRLRHVAKPDAEFSNFARRRFLKHKQLYLEFRGNLWYEIYVYTDSYKNCGNVPRISRCYQTQHHKIISIRNVIVYRPALHNSSWEICCRKKPSGKQP